MALVAIFIASPGREGFLDGIPLESPHELIVLAIAFSACWLAPMRMPDAGRKRKWIYALFFVLTIATAGKVAIGAMSIPRGLQGSYALPSGKPETRRIDRNIMFSDKGYAYGERTFPVWFMNDRERFNQAGLDRTKMPFTAEWNGYAHMETARPDIMFDHSGNASIEIDGVPAERFVTWKTGMYPIRIRYESGTENGRFLHLVRKSDKEAFDELFPERYEPQELARDAIAGKIGVIALFFGAWAAALAFILLASGAAWRQWMGTWRPMALVIGAICTMALLARIWTAAQSPYSIMLYSGSDDLSYETFSRHMRLTGDWDMSMLEQEAYYYQLYYYFVAMMHGIGGEGLLPIFIMQAILLVVAGFFIMRTGMRMAKVGNGWKEAFPFLAAFAGIALMPELGKEAMRLMPTIPGICATAIAAWMIVCAGETPGKKGIALSAMAGAMLGVGIMNRYNFLVWAPFVVLYAGIGKHDNRWIRGVACALGIAVMLCPFVLRNKIVANQWRLVSQSNTTANFMMGTPVPEGFEPESVFLAETKPILSTFFDGRVNRTIGWIRERPYDYLRLVYGKAARAISLHPVLWIAFVISSLIWLIKPSLLSAQLERKEYILWGGFVIGQFIAITLMSTGDGRYYAVTMPFLILSLALSVGRSMNSLFHSSKQIKSQIR